MIALNPQGIFTSTSDCASAELGNMQASFRRESAGSGLTGIETSTVRRLGGTNGFRVRGNYGGRGRKDLEPGVSRVCSIKRMDPVCGAVASFIMMLRFFGLDPHDQLKQ